MKKFLLVVVFLVLTGGGVYFYYLYLQKQKSIDVWHLPPSGAIWIYETNQTVFSWNRLITRPYWANMESLPFFNSLKNQFETLDSIAGKGGNIDKMLRNNPLLISCHLTSKNEFDYVFYFKMREASHHSLVRDVLAGFSKQEGHQLTTRELAGYKINEIINKKAGVVFSYIFINDHFVGSFAPILIEEVIRNLNNNSKNSFFANHPVFANLNKIETDDGNLYIDAGRLFQFLGVFTGKDNSSIKHLSQLASSIYLDIETENNFLLFNGTSHAPADSGYFISTFQNQKSGSFNLSAMVPYKTAALFKYSFSDPARWQNSLNKYWQRNNSSFYQTRLKFEKENELSLSSFVSWMGDGVGLALMESINPDNPDKLVYLSANDLNEGLKRFNRLAEWSAEQKGDTVYVEDFGGYRISMIDIANTPEMMFGPQFSGFEQSYFTSFGKYIILSNSSNSLKNLLTDIENENVWGKSIKHTRFLENTLPESNISLIINTERCWNTILQKLDPEWRSIFQQYAPQLKKLEFLAVQFNQVDNRYYSSIIIEINKEPVPERSNDQLAIQQQVITDAPIITKPYIVRNHNDKSMEVVLQDSTNQIYLISKNGEVLWKLKLQKPIVGDIRQIDFYRNGKLQYLFADDQSIKLIDRNGDFVPGFPMHFPDSINIQTLSVIDYDNSRRYRMLISDTRGNLYLYSMGKENLEGWTPLSVNSKVAFPPEHFRVRGRDCMVAVEKKGIVHLLTRRGEYYDGFPLNLNAEMDSPMFFENGGSLKDSKFHVINNNGVILQFNLLGKTINSTQLYKPSRETKFMICPDISKQTYVVARQDFNRLTLMDRKGDAIFEKDYITSDNLSVQYYHFSMDNKIFAVTDKIQEFTYIYDASGQLINYQPLESSFEIGLIYSEAQKKFHVYSCYENRFTVSSFNRK